MKKAIIIFSLLLLFFTNKIAAQCTNTNILFSATTIVSNISCALNDGSITVNAANGYTDVSAGNHTGYSYAITAGPLTRITQSNNIFAALPAGAYTLKITDCHGDSLIKSAIVGGTAPAPLAFNPTVFKSVCASNNAIKVGPSGGRAPYTIKVVSAPAGSSPLMRGDTIRNLTAGTLSIIITDVCGNTLAATATITSNYPAPTIPTTLNYYGCDGTIGYPFTTYRTGPQIDYNYVPSFATPGLVLNPVVDTFYVDLYFNNKYRQTLSFGGNTILSFTGYGFGTYKMVNYTKCGGIFKTDSVTVGNRPSSPKGTNTNLAIQFGYVPKCQNFDAVIQAHWGVVYINYNTKGQVVDVMNTPFKVKILSGPDHVGKLVRTTTYYDTLSNLTYGGSYVVEATDTCGKKDTISFNVPRPFQKVPTGTVSCGYSPSNMLDRFCPIFARNYFPLIAPIKYKFLSGTNIPWIKGKSYPITVVDSIGGDPLVLPASALQGTYTIAYENACGDKDTTIYSVSCSSLIPKKISAKLTPLCGNRSNITLTQRSSGSAQVFVNLLSGPAGNTVNQMTTDSVTYLGQPAGTYIFRGTLRGDLPVTQQYVDYVYYNKEGATTAAGTSVPGFPVMSPWYGPHPYSVNYSGAIDTSKLRVWDTVFTITVSPTKLTPIASENYLCKGGTSANILMSTPGGVGPFTYQYSIASNTGPFSTAQSDSLIQIDGITPGQSIFIKTTDGCGSSVVINSTAGYLTATVNSSCDNGIATITPNPFNKDFIYEFVQNSTGNVISFFYPNAPSIDLSNASNAGDYTIRYRLASGGSTSCIVDSTNLLLSSPCKVGLPVNYNYVKATSNNCSVTIQWQTLQEINSKSFVVESSVDAGITWNIVSTINAAGTSSVAKNYSVTISPGNAKKLLYRLKEIDKDGRFAYSASLPVVVNCLTADDVLKVSPNPVPQNNNLNFELLSNEVKGNAHLIITDIQGRKCVNKAVVISDSQNNYSLSTINLSKGTYFAKIVTDKGNWQSNIVKIIIGF